MECKKSIQFAVNGILTVPKQTPPIDFILRVTSTPIIKKTIIINKQINFSGQVMICIEFVSSKPDHNQTVHFISFEAPFIGLINHSCARSGMDCQLSASIKQQDFQLVNPKSINKLIVIKVCILKLTKSCNSANSHCYGPHLTLLCTPDKIKTCPPKHPFPPPPSKEDHYERSLFTDFHIPFSEQLESTEHDRTVSYNSYENQIEHE